MDYLAELLINSAFFFYLSFFPWYDIVNLSVGGYGGCYNKMEKHTSKAKTYIIGISGGSASGKTTIADYLKQNLADLKISLFHMDDYFKEKSKRPVIKGIVDGKQYVDDNHPSTLDLDQFHKDVKKVLSEDWDVIILEGVFSLWDEELLPLYDLKIYVDCDPEERFVRRIKRHLSYGQDFDEITQRYIQAVKPRHMEFVESTKWKADIILNGFQMSSVGFDMILTWVQNYFKA